MNNLFLLTQILFGNKGGKKSSKSPILAAVGFFAFLMLIVVIVFMLMFIPFAGPLYMNKMKNEAKNAASAAGMKLNTEDPMDNKGFIEDLKAAIKYGDNWDKVLAAMQTKRMMYNTEDIEVDEAGEAVASNNVKEWLMVLPKGVDAKEYQNMDSEEALRMFEQNQKIIEINIGPYIGTKRIEELKKIPLNKGRVENWKYENSKANLSFDIVGETLEKTETKLNNIISARTTPDEKTFLEEVKDPVIAKEYSDSVVYLQSSPSPSGEFGIIANFPLSREIKVEDKDIVSAFAFYGDDTELNKNLEMPLGESAETIGMATYISTKKGTPVLIPENSIVIDIKKNEKASTFAVVLQSLDNERRYKFDNLQKLKDDCRVGKYYIVAPGTSAVFGYVGSGKKGAGLLKMNTYTNFNLLFKDDVAENPEVAKESMQKTTDYIEDPAATDGFVEVDSYKTVLIMRESRVNKGPETENVDKIFKFNKS